jgi:hypothetical protein
MVGMSFFDMWWPLRPFRGADWWRESLAGAGKLSAFDPTFGRRSRSGPSTEVVGASTLCLAFKLETCRMRHLQP